jgi:nucleotide-binding universal stress UspA family protein
MNTPSGQRPTRNNGVMDHIVVGMDGSEGAARALRWAARESKITDIPLTAMLAWDYGGQHHVDADQGFDPDYDADDAAIALDAYVRRALGNEEVELAKVVTLDLPARALIDASRSASLLVVGARGLGGFAGLLLGSVSQRCLRGSECPVAIIRRSARVANGTAGEPPEFGRIVVGVDGSTTGQHALEWAVAEAARRSARLVALHAWQPSYLLSAPLPGSTRYLEAMEAEGKVVLDQALARADLTALDGRIDRVDKLGSPAGALLEASVDADMVVVATGTHHRIGALVVGSVAHQISQHATCPAVFVPSHAEPDPSPV